MRRVIMARVIDAVPTMLLVLTFLFVVLRLLPGDPAQVALGDNASAAQIAALRARMGLDASLGLQYVRFIWSVTRLDFGVSFITGVPVRELLAENLPYTIELMAMATIIGTAIGVPLGVVSATRRGGGIDFGSRIFVLIGYALPDFYLGALLLIGLSLNLGLFPVSGGGEGFADRMYHLFLPALALGLVKSAFVSRLTRTAMLDVLGRVYVRTARAKGISETRVIYRHALRNALLPVCNGLALSILATLSGSVAIELIFNRPGVGNMLIEGIATRDYPVVQAGLVVFALCVVVVNLLMDLLSAAIDPRIRANA